ncbi:hypothetical protein SLA2020_236110 [Shorea laevis]
MNDARSSEAPQVSRGISDDVARGYSQPVSRENTMENSRNPNFNGIGCEDEHYRRFGNPRFLTHQRTTMSEQNHLANNGTLVESEYTRRQYSAGNMDSRHQLMSSGVNYYSISAGAGAGAGTGTGQMWHQQSCLPQQADLSSADSQSRIYSHNISAGEPELLRQQQLSQRQHEDISSADSNSRRKFSAITEEWKPRKREANRVHIEIGKEELEALQVEIGQLRLENESLRQENAMQKKQIDDLKKYEAQHEAMEAEIRRLKDKYIELLEKSNPLVEPRFGTHPSELGQQHVQLTSFSRASACGSVTGHHANPC